MGTYVGIARRRQHGDGVHNNGMHGGSTEMVCITTACMVAARSWCALQQLAWLCPVGAREKGYFNSVVTDFLDQFEVKCLILFYCFFIPIMENVVPESENKTLPVHHLRKKNPLVPVLGRLNSCDSSLK